MEMTPEAIKALLDAFDRSDWQEMTVTVGPDRLHVSRDPSDGAAPPAPAPAPAVPAGDTPAAAPPAPLPAPAAAAPEPLRPADDATGTPIVAPSVGLFWRAPSPGSPPFVEEGGRVEAGETVAIVEVMKLMNHVVAPEAGLVTAILVENGGAVEFGQPLVVVDSAG